MNRSTILTYAALLAAACAANAQSRGIGIPVAGFVVDPTTHSIRPIKGFPGASMLGNPIDLSINVQAAMVSVNGEFALVINGNPMGQLLLVRGLKGDAPTVQLVDGTVASVDLIGMNDAGTAAVILSKTAGQLQFISGLPDSPSVQAPIALTSLIGQSTAVAVDSEGHFALVTSSDGTYGGVYLTANQEGATPQLIAAAYKPSAVVFTNHDQDAVFADGFSSEIVQLQSLSANITRTVLVSAEDNVQNLIAVQSMDGTLVAVSLGSSDASPFGKVIQYDLAARRIIGDRPLPVASTRLDRLGGSANFVINDTGMDVLYVYSASDFSMMFVPSAN